MEYADTPSQSLEYAAAAIEEMRKRSIMPNPNNYSVWYIYVTNRLPDLTKAISDIDATGQGYNDEQCAELFNRFVSSSTQEAMVAETSDQLSHRMSSVIESISSASDHTEKFGADLDNAMQRLNGMGGADEVKSTIAEARAATEEMSQHSRALEVELREINVEVTQLREDLEVLREEAFTDGLTGIANRKRFDVALRHETTISDGNGDPLSLLMIDIDHFKKFNDTFGHSVGDQVLRLLAATMVENVKGRDIPARYGGEEFAIILPNTDLTNASMLAEQIRAAIGTKSLRNKTSGEDLGQITISIGVGSYRSGENLVAFIDRADQALYDAKNKGRNRVETEQHEIKTELSIHSG